MWKKIRAKLIERTNHNARILDPYWVDKEVALMWSIDGRLRVIDAYDKLVCVESLEEYPVIVDGICLLLTKDWLYTFEVIDDEN